jgi:hypothetical protein
MSSPLPRLCDRENGTLVRYDIIQGLRRLFDAVKGIRKKALALIATEKGLKYRAKYATLWR